MKNKIKVMSVFSGVGGLEQGLDPEVFDVIGHSEINKSSCQILNYHYPNIKNFGDISKIETSKLPKYDMLVGGSPCFRKGTLILTENGLKPIEEVSVGELVLTHENRYRPVLKRMINHTQSIHKMTAYGLDELYVTEGHPLYVIEKLADGSFSKPAWLGVKDITTNHFLLKPIYKEYKKFDYKGYETTINQNTTELKKSLNFDNLAFWELLGRFLGDGWVTTLKRKERKNSFTYKFVICCGKTEFSELVELFDKNDFEYSYIEEKTTYKFNIYNEELCRFALEMIGKDCYTKVVPQFVMNAEDSQIERFVKGYFESDGCHIQSKNIYKFTSVNKTLLYQIQNLIQKLHKQTSGFYVNPARDGQIGDRVIKGKEYYNLVYYQAFNKDKKLSKTFQYNEDLIAVKVTSNEIENTDENVYNFDVQDDHSYVANNIIAHNCQDLSMAGAKKGLVSGKKSSLFFIFAKLLKENQPDFFIWENVKGTFYSSNGLDFLAVQKEFHECGYHFQWQLLNSEDFGVVQVRNRVFVVGAKRKEDLPGLIEVVRNKKLAFQSLKFSHFCGSLINDGLVQTITASYGALSGNGTKIIEKLPATKQTLEEVIASKNNTSIRMLTAIEGERLMSWGDDWTKYGKKADGTLVNITERERYKAIGNGIVSNCIKNLLTNFKKNPVELEEQEDLSKLSNYMIHSDKDEHKKLLTVFKLKENEDYVVKGKTFYIKSFKFVEAIFKNERLRETIGKVKHPYKGVLTLDKKYMKNKKEHVYQSTLGTLKLSSFLEKKATNKKYLSQKECEYIYKRLK